MQRIEGLHFYINIANLNEVIADEEYKTKKVNHSIHALDTFFSSIEKFGKKHFKSFVVEKVTGSRLHMYVEDADVSAAFVVVAEVSKFAHKLTSFINNDISKYKTLKNFRIQIGACYGRFYSFEFKTEDIDEETTIGYAANYAAKLQGLALPGYIAISSNIYEALADNDSFEKRKDGRIKKYDQEYYATALISSLASSFDISEELSDVKEKANNLNLSDIVFTYATKELDFSGLSRKSAKDIIGIPFFSDVRGFTSQFEEDDSNLEEMAEKTQSILSSMYGVVRKHHGVHIQFQGDREFAVFHNYSDYDCVVDAVQAGLRMIDGVHTYGVSVGIGESLGRLFAAKIGARGEKDNILIGTTVTQADKLEDEEAKENQLVISKEIYESLKSQKPKWAKYFSKVNDNCFRITIGYSKLLNSISQEQLLENNKQNNYNKAWGEY